MAAKKAKKKPKAKAKVKTSKAKAKPAAKKPAKVKAAKSKPAKAKPAKAKKSKAPVKAKAKTPVKAVKKTAKKKKQIVGEGDYAATRKFDKDQTDFVKQNAAKIPELGKAAEAALDGPEGDSLRDAEASAAGRSRDTF